MIKESILKTDLQDRITSLIRSDLTFGYMHKASQDIFESVVVDRLAQGVKWKKCVSLEKIEKNQSVTGEKIVENSKWITFDLRVPTKRDTYPKYNDMEKNVIYFPVTKPDYPFVDAMYKVDDIVYGLQITRTGVTSKEEKCVRELKLSTYKNFINDLNIPDENFKFVLVVAPSMSTVSEVNYVEKVGNGKAAKIVSTNKFLSHVEVWQIPINYRDFPQERKHSSEEYGA